MRAVLLLMLLGCLAAAPATTQIGSTSQPNGHGPDTVILRELVGLYQPVPFDHKTHAEMAEMWDGCTTCHHRSPEPATQAGGTNHKTQAESSKYPACKSCHEIKTEDADIRKPSLKGAYHRQCLNCHREWANANSCTVCHEPVEGIASTRAPTRDDIVDRMHPPIPEPDVKIYTTRFTPAVGNQAIFRHKEHSTRYGLKCVNCHRHDSCSSCHSAKPEASGPRLLHPGRTWADTHGPCISCHQEDRCRTCHYNEGETPPEPFEHRQTGQTLDKDHRNLSCAQCHIRVKATTELTCGDSSCHKPQKHITFPKHRPGKLLAVTPTTKPSTQPVVQTVIDSSGTVIKRVRRGAVQ